MSARVQTMIGATALLLWAASLAFPAYWLDASAACQHPHPWMGYLVLVLGGLGPLALHFEWLANPLILLAAVRWLRYRGDVWRGPLALAVAVWSFGLRSVTADTTETVCRTGLGLHLWCAATLILTGGALAASVQARRAQARD